MSFKTKILFLFLLFVKRENRTVQHCRSTIFDGSPYCHLVAFVIAVVFILFRLSFTGFCCQYFFFFFFFCSHPIFSEWTVSLESNGHIVSAHFLPVSILVQQVVSSPNLTNAATDHLPDPLHSAATPHQRSNRSLTWRHWWCSTVYPPACCHSSLTRPEEQHGRTAPTYPTNTATDHSPGGTDDAPLLIPKWVIRDHLPGGTDDAPLLIPKRVVTDHLPGGTDDAPLLIPKCVVTDHLPGGTDDAPLLIPKCVVTDHLPGGTDDAPLLIPKRVISNVFLGDQRLFRHTDLFCRNLILLWWASWWQTFNWGGALKLYSGLLVCVTIWELA